MSQLSVCSLPSMKLELPCERKGALKKKDITFLNPHAEQDFSKWKRSIALTALVLFILGGGGVAGGAHLFLHFTGLTQLPTLLTGISVVSTGALIELGIPFFCFKVGSSLKKKEAALEAAPRGVDLLNALQEAPKEELPERLSEVPQGMRLPLIREIESQFKEHGSSLPPHLIPLSQVISAHKGYLQQAEIEGVDPDLVELLGLDGENHSIPTISENQSIASIYELESENEEITSQCEDFNNVEKRVEEMRSDPQLNSHIQIAREESGEKLSAEGEVSSSLIDSDFFEKNGTKIVSDETEELLQTLFKEEKKKSSETSDEEIDSFQLDNEEWINSVLEKGIDSVENESEKANSVFEESLDNEEYQRNVLLNWYSYEFWKQAWHFEHSLTHKFRLRLIRALIEIESEDWKANLSLSFIAQYFNTYFKERKERVMPQESFRAFAPFPELLIALIKHEQTRDSVFNQENILKLFQEMEGTSKEPFIFELLQIPELHYATITYFYDYIVQSIAFRDLCVT